MLKIILPLILIIVIILTLINFITKLKTDIKRNLLDKMFKNNDIDSDLYKKYLND